MSVLEKQVLKITDFCTVFVEVSPGKAPGRWHVALVRPEVGRITARSFWSRKKANRYAHLVSKSLGLGLVFRGQADG